MRTGNPLTLALLVGFVIFLRIRERQRDRASKPDQPAAAV
jgi:hypothetical protein